MDQTKIKVVVRKRPMSKKEKDKSDVDIMEQRGSQTVAVKEIKYRPSITMTVVELRSI